MSRLKGKGTAVAVIISLMALGVSLGGTSVADVATSALSGKDKRDVRRISTRIANRRVRALSPRLPARFAANAGFANSAGNANSVAGKTIVSWDRRAVPEGTVGILVATLGTLQFKVGCSIAPNARLEVRTTTGNGNYMQTNLAGETLITTGDTIVEQVTNNRVTRSFTAVGPTVGNVVTGAFTLAHSNTSQTCNIRGMAIG